MILMTMGMSSDSILISKQTSNAVMTKTRFGQIKDCPIS